MVGLRDNKLKLTSRETIQQLIGKGFVACVWGGSYVYGMGTRLHSSGRTKSE